jgi:hypothetical protein
MKASTSSNRTIGRLRLGTLLLLALAAGLGLGLVVQQRRVARLRAVLAPYRDPRQEAMLDALEAPVPLSWPDDTPLDEVLKQLKARTTGLPGLPAGFPIYVDPLGLQEAEQTLSVQVKALPPGGPLPLAESLRRVLEPLGLAFEARDGFLMITSRESVQEPVTGQDPYLQYRDDLR